jgi:hypothetical protein
MAKFCTTCGSPIEETVKFCPKCGTQLGAPSAPAPAVASPTPAAAQTAGASAVPTAAAAPPGKMGSPILKIILALVGVFAFVTVLGIGACVYAGYKLKQKGMALVESAKTMSSSSAGTPEVHAEKRGAGSEAAASATADVAPYPGSTATKAGGELWPGIGGQQFVTSDPLDKVVAFYKDKFGSRLVAQESEGNAVLTLTTKSGMTTITITRDEDAGQTKITIMRIGK